MCRTNAAAVVAEEPPTFISDDRVARAFEGEKIPPALLNDPRGVTVASFQSYIEDLFDQAMADCERS